MVEKALVGVDAKAIGVLFSCVLGPGSINNGCSAHLVFPLGEGDPLLIREGEFTKDLLGWKVRYALGIQRKTWVRTRSSLQ